MSQQNRTVIVFNQTLTAAAPGFTVNLQQQGVSSNATTMVVRQLIYSNIAGTDTGTYLLSMNNRNIAAVYVAIQSETICPGTTITVPNFQPNATFRLTPANSSFTGPTGQLTLVLEFY